HDGAGRQAWLRSGIRKQRRSTYAPHYDRRLVPGGSPRRRLGRMTMWLSGRRSAKREANPTASEALLFGGSVHAVVRRHRTFEAAIGGRFFRYEFLMAIFPFRNVKMSQPFTSTRLPSLRVHVNVHSETPRSPCTKWRAFPQWASGKVANTSI